ncbi:MAG TPA: 50S ribosomal protein L16 [Candidatus Nanoarchaeia archaeon]|nr:50S ribosomal protein L16 [Candidatus Nanoarchaeia archaeon]
MVGLRTFRCYRRLERPYTRKSKYKKKNYIRSFPPHKIARFGMGTSKAYSHVVKYVARGSLQIRNNALESARLVVNNRLQEVLGQEYFLKLNVFPHHALRENKMLGGAHADRLQTGMAHSFGKVIGTAAQIKTGTIVFTAFVDKAQVEKAGKALAAAGPRLPGKYLVRIEENKRGIVPT